MKLFKNWKKAAVLVMTGVMLTSTPAMPAMAHGHHGGGHHGSYSYTSTGTYCAYHCTTHKNAANCKYYCTKHHKTHKNGRCH